MRKKRGIGWEKEGQNRNIRWEVLMNLIIEHGLG